MECIRMKFEIQGLQFGNNLKHFVQSLNFKEGLIFEDQSLISNIFLWIYNLILWNSTIKV